jgi:hypothetical protein
MAKHIKFGRPDSAVLSANARDDLLLNPLGENRAAIVFCRPAIKNV